MHDIRLIRTAPAAFRRAAMARRGLARTIRRSFWPWMRPAALRKLSCKTVGWSGTPQPTIGGLKKSGDEAGAAAAMAKVADMLPLRGLEAGRIRGS